MKEIIIGGMCGLLFALGLLPGVLHDAKRYCDQGYKICVVRP
jgi:hypothetical protein